MPPLTHHPLAIHQHIPHLAIATGKQPPIENPVAIGCRQIWIVAIEHQPVGAFADFQRANRLAQRLSTAIQRRIEQRAANHRLIRAIQTITPLVAQTLAVFQPTQFFHHAQ